MVYRVTFLKTAKAVSGSRSTKISVTCQPRRSRQMNRSFGPATASRALEHLANRLKYLTVVFGWALKCWASCATQRLVAGLPFPRRCNKFPGVQNRFAHVSTAYGFWGAGGAFRVLPRPELSDGWQVVERLSNLQGIPTGSVA